MEFTQLQATFGKLQGARLDLAPGLNILYAPNESGKSTWCQFLRVMLYGLRGRGSDADKVRFAPWSGAAMAGTVELREGEETYTLSRTTRRASAPMGELSCTYAATATPCPLFAGREPGEVLPGVPLSVYERSAYIRQCGLAVSQSPELEKRITALITTGEEDVSFSESYERLKKERSSRQYNRTGAIPALEREIGELRQQQDLREELLRQTRAAQEELELAQQQVKLLELQQDLWQRRQRQEAVQAYRLAQTAAGEAEQKAAWLLAQAGGTLPEEDALRRMEGQCAALQGQQEALRHARESADAARVQADTAAAQWSTHPLYPEDEAACRAKLETIAAPAAPSPLLTAVGILLTLGGAAGAFWRLPLVLFAVSGLACIAIGLTRRKNARIAQAKASAQRTALEAQIAAYLPLMQRKEEAELAARQAAAAARGLQDAYQQQLLALLSGLQVYAPAAGDLSGAQVALAQLRQQHLGLADARQAAREAALRRDLLAGNLPEGPLPEPEEDLPEPTLSREAVAAQLPQALERQSRLRSRYDMLTGQLRSLGSGEDLRAALAQKQERLSQLHREFAAVETAMEVLDSAHTALQNRFSPELGRRAGEIFARLTGGRYQKVLLSRELHMQAQSAEDATARAAELLSQGATDQLYLAVRLAICQMVLPQSPSVPLILDDALVSFDDRRLHAALDYLLEESRSRQILLFTCQHREADYLRGRQGVHISSL